MSGVRGEMRYEYRGQYSLYSTEFTDEQGNRWEIELVGFPEIIREIVDQQAIFIETESITPEEFDMSRQQAEKSGKDNQLPELLAPSIPELIGQIRLVERASSEPLRASIVIDPNISVGAQHSYSFTVGAGDQVANVTAYASLGDVALRLIGEGKESAAPTSGVMASLAATNSATKTFYCYVYWTNGPDGATYTLRGDLNLGE